MNTSLKLFALLVFSILFLTSCGDDDEVVDREPLIIGTWTLAAQRAANVTANGIELPQSVFEQFLGDFAIIPDGSEITFDQDGTYSVRTPQQPSDFSSTWVLSDDQTTITLSGLDEAEDLLGSSSLVFVILGINDTNFNLNTTSSDITIPNVPNFGTVNASGDYELNLEK